MAQAPIFLARGQSIASNGDLLVSTGLTVPETQAVPFDQLQGLRQSMGLPLQGGISTTLGYSNTFFRVRSTDVTPELADRFPPLEVIGAPPPWLTQPPPPPPPPPPGPAAPFIGFIERAPRGSGVLLSGRVTNVAAREVVDLVASVFNDDGRRNNIQWVATGGVLTNQNWDLATWQAPNIVTDGIRVQALIDGRATAAATLFFNIVQDAPPAPPGQPPFTLDELLNAQLWQDILGNQEQVIQAVAQDLPQDLQGFRQQVQQLFSSTVQDVQQTVGSANLDTQQLINIFGSALGANVALAGLPAQRALLGPIIDALPSLQIPTPESIWTAFIDQATGPLQLVLSTGFTLFFDALELPLAGILRPLVSQLQEVPELPNEIRALFGELEQPSQAVVLPILIMAGAMLVQGATSAMVSPVVRDVQHYFNRLRPNELLPINQALDAHFRGFVDSASLQEEVAGHGINDDRLALLLEIERPRLDVQAINLQVLRAEMHAASHPQVQELVNQYDPGISPELAGALLGFLGWDQRQREQLLDQRLQLPGAQDLVRFAVREAVEQDVIQGFGLDDEFDQAVAPLLPFFRGQGLPDEFTRFFWRAHWEFPSTQQGFEMLHRAAWDPFFGGQEPAGDIGGRPYFTLVNEAEIDRLFRTADIMPFWRERLKQVAFNVVTRVDIRRMYRLGAVTADDVELTYLSDGYRPQDAAALRQFVEREALNGALGDRETEARGQFRQGLIDAATFRQLIQPVSFLDEVIDESVNTAELDRAGQRTLDQVNAWTSALRKDLTTQAAFRQALQDLGIPDNEIDFRVALVGIQQGSDDPSVAQLELRAVGQGTVQRRFREGLVDQAQFTQEMGLLGYQAGQTVRYQALADLEFDTNLSLDLLSAYRAGLRSGRLTEDQFTQRVQALGIRQELVDSYLEYDRLRRALDEPTQEEQEVRAVGRGTVIRRFREGWTTSQQFSEEMLSLGYTQREANRYQVLADLEFDLDFKTDSLTALAVAFREDVISADDLLQRLATLGMDQERAQVHLAREQLRKLAPVAEVEVLPEEVELPP